MERTIGVMATAPTVTATQGPALRRPDVPGTNEAPTRGQRRVEAGARSRTHRAARLSDGELVLRCRAGDQSAWSELVSRHTSRLWHIARREGLDASAAQDAVQNTWSSLYTSLNRLDNVDAVGGWLSTAVRREAIRLSKRQRRETPLLASEADWSSTVDERLLTTERLSILRAAFARLQPSDQRLLAMLFADCEPSYVEIACELRRPIGSIGPTRARALARLAVLLQGKI